MIRVERKLHAALYYHVLAHLELGRDAASVFDPRLGAKPWLESLRAAYFAASDPLAAQHVPLNIFDLPGLLNVLQNREVPRLDAALADALDAAVRAEAPIFVPAWRAAEAEALRRIEAVRAELSGPLALLRHTLWAQLEKDPPPLRIVDCRALGRHGRGAHHKGERVVAVSLGEPTEHVLLQVLHEEVHPVSDRLVGVKARSTRADDAGFAEHARIEAAAVELGRRVVEAVAPEWVEPYQRWCARAGA